MAERPLRSVRARITLLATAALVVILLVTGGLLLVALRRSLTDDLDDGLRQRATTLVELAAADRLPDTIATPGDDDDAAQVVSPDGRVLASTANLAGEPPVAASTARGLRTVDGIPVDDSPFRILSRPAGDLRVHVLANLDDVEESLAALRVSLLVLGPVVALLLAGLTWWLVGRTLRPVEAIRAELDAIDGAGLHRRVPVGAGGDEVDRLARTMNAMLDRVEGAAERQRRFVADASHELRTPLARMRSELEVDLTHPDGADPWDTHRSALEEVVGMEQLVADLLHLARADAGAVEAPDTPVRLDLVVRREVDLAAASGAPVELASAGGITVGGDAGQLARALRNILDNAARAAATSVHVAVVTTDRTVEVAVTDDGPGIAPEEAEAVFERFRRLDESRTASTGGAGLGLTIARDIAERHGGGVHVDPSYTEGARVVLRLPLATAARR